ncbi:fimbrial protein [Pseudomonas yamanorum]
MKRIYIALAALASISAMSAVQASDGTVNFGGMLLTNTCNISVNGGTNVGTVTLPTLSTVTLGTAGATAGRTNFTIGLSGCNKSIYAFLNGVETSPLYGVNTTLSNAYAYFENGAGVDPVSKNILNASGTATGVQLQLVRASGLVIKAGDSTQLQVIGNPISGGLVAGQTAVMNYAVQYIATAATTPGSVVGSVTYSIAYN